MKLQIMHRDSVNVIVDKQELKPEEVAQILDIECGNRGRKLKILK